jgi:hypothetical protein
MKSSKSVRGLTKPLEGHYIITKVDPTTSEPLQPKNNAKKFINHYGVLLGIESRSASVNGKIRRLIL